MKASVILKIKIVGALTINAVGKNTFKGEEKLLTRQKITSYCISMQHLYKNTCIIMKYEICMGCCMCVVCPFMCSSTFVDYCQLQVELLGKPYFNSYVSSSRTQGVSNL